MLENQYISKEHNWEPRKCPVCGKMFDPNQHNQKYCSKECYRVISNKRSKKYYHDHKKECQERMNQWRREHPHLIKMYNKKYKDTHRESISAMALERSRKWRSENPERYKEQYAKANHRKAILKCSREHNNCFDCFTEDGNCIFD